MDLGTGLAIGAVVIACLNFAYLQFAVIAGVKERLARVETKMELFWGPIQRKTIEILKSPTNARKDELLEHLGHGTLTSLEASELRDILQGEMENRVINGGTGLAYALAIGRLDQIIFDFRICNKKTKVEG